MFVVGLVVAAWIAFAFFPAVRAVPGNPGIPQGAVVLYEEDFENEMATQPVLLTDYTGAPPHNMTYTADPVWVSGANCNGIIASFNTSDTLSCSFGTQIRNQAQAMGIFHNAGSANSNHALTAYTANQSPAVDAVQFETVQSVALAAASRFVTFSVDAAAQNCHTTHPVFKFYLVEGTNEIPLFNNPIDPCTAQGDPTAPPQAINGMRVGRYLSDEPVLFTGNSLGLRMRNASGVTAGNDSSIDNIRVLDVTPQLDKRFSPDRIGRNGTSMLTFTVTNTSDLLPKNGWSFSDMLPANLTVADTTDATTTCSNGSVSAVEGSNIINASGDLQSGEAFCTITVTVTSAMLGTYNNCASNLSSIAGLNEPDCATLTIEVPRFNCSSDGLLFQVPSGNTTIVSSVDIATGESEQMLTIPDYNINAVGYNVVDNYVYGWSNNQVVRIGSDGTVQGLGSPAGVALTTYATGDVDNNGHYWLSRHEDGSRWYQIDLNTHSPTFMTVLSTGIIPSNGGADWAYVPGTNALYRTRWTSGSILMRFDRTTKTHAVAAANFGFGAGVGAVYADSDGFLYTSNNANGHIYRVNVVTGEAEFFANGPSSAGNDGARCASAAVPIDFGDAPDSYGTSLGNDGARHSVLGYEASTNTAALMLGDVIDTDLDGQPSMDAQGDNNGQDDEDGVAAPIYSYTGTTTAVDVIITNETDEPATLAGWIDLNNNGSFETAERVALTIPANSGQSTQTLLFPPGTSTSDTFARFRLFGGLVTDPQPIGSAAGGEVEDYEVLANIYKVTKTVSPANGRLLPGDTATYTIMVSASSEAPPAGYTSFTDDLSDILDDAVYNNDASASSGSVNYAAPVLAWQGSLGPGESATITYTATVQPGGDMQMTNAVTGGQCPDPPITDPTNLGFIEECSTTILVESPQADMTLSKSHVGSPLAGDVFEYNFVVTNNGPHATPSWLVSDQLDQALTFVGASPDSHCTAIDQAVTCQGGALDAGQSAVLTIYVEVASDHDGSTIANTATVSGPLPDPQPGNNISEDLFNPTAQANIAIEKELVGDFVAGTQTTYNLVVTNHGPSAAENVTVTDQLPEELTPVAVSAPSGWSCVFVANGISCLYQQTMYPDDVAVLSFVVAIADDVRGEVENVATITATTFDPTPDDNRGIALAQVLASTDLAMQKMLIGELVAGQRATYRLAVTNHGPSDATNPVVTDNLPDELSYISSNNANWQCSNVGQEVTCHKNYMANGETENIDLEVEVDQDAAGSIINNAVVSAMTSDPRPENNSSSVRSVIRRSDALAATGGNAIFYTVVAVFAIGAAVGARRLGKQYV